MDFFKTTATIFFLLLTLSALGQTNYHSLNYLYKISGKQTISGQHNKEPNADPDRWTDWIKDTTGHFPGLWSGDFLFRPNDIQNRWAIIYEAREQWNKGALVNIMWHACNPVAGEPGEWNSSVQKRLTDEQWNELISEGTPLNNKWKSMMDEIAVYLKFLKDNNVEVLFRPLHEMNQGAFWWGGRPGKAGTQKLWKITRDYMTKNKGLTNLIWVWDMQDFKTLASDLNAYNPGKDYWDVAALDIYEGFDTWKYEAMLKAADGKPIAIGECDVLPTPQRLQAEPKWTFFMCWAELVKEKNTVKAIRDLYGADNVIKREQMPVQARRDKKEK